MDGLQLAPESPAMLPHAKESFQCLKSSANDFCLTGLLKDPHRVPAPSLQPPLLFPLPTGTVEGRATPWKDYSPGGPTWPGSHGSPWLLSHSRSKYGTIRKLFLLARTWLQPLATQNFGSSTISKRLECVPATHY